MPNRGLSGTRSRGAEGIHSTPGPLVASAFGYSESPLRFHEGNAWTHLGDTRMARQAQQRALELCPADDFMDRALTKLDHSQCLVSDGDVTGAMTHASETISSLSGEELKGIILLRGNEIASKVPECSRKHPAVREFRDLLVMSGRAPES